MDQDFPRVWMWSEACEMLARAERLHRQLFRPIGSIAQLPAWEPPVDILETDSEVLVLVALPGVDIDNVEAALDGANDLLVVGTRTLPPRYARRSFIVSRFRKVGSSAECAFPAAVTMRCGVRAVMVVS
jgi:HSP20 family molecular chaperone IbpA